MRFWWFQRFVSWSNNDGPNWCVIFLFGVKINHKKDVGSGTGHCRDETQVPFTRKNGGFGWKIHGNITGNHGYPRR